MVVPEIVLVRGARSWPPRARRIAVGVADPDEQPPADDDPTAPARAVVVSFVTAVVDSVETLAPAVKPAVNQLRDTARRVLQLLPG